MAPKKKKIRNESPLTAQVTGAISSGASKSKPKKKSKEHKPMSKKAQIRAKKEAMEKEEEERLTALLFGGGAINQHEDSDRSVSSEENNNEEGFEMESNVIENEEGGDFAFEIDRGGDASGDEGDGSQEGQLTQAWNDEDDDDDDAGDHSVDMNDDDDSEAIEEEESAPAWEDPDDAKTALIDGSSRLKKLRRTRDEKDALSSHELEQRLRQRYATSSQSTARTDWATKSKKQRTAVDKDDEYGEGEDNDDAALSLFSTSKSLLASSRNQLPPNVLDIVRCPDANLVDPNKAVVRCIDFHPGSEPEQPLMLTAGLDKTLRFFQVGEEKSEKIHGIHFPEMPIYSASFLGNTGKVVLSGRRKFFYFYDAISGKVDLVPGILGREERSWEKHTVSPDGEIIAFVGNDGYIVLVDAHSKQSIGSLKLNGSVRAITFTPDGSELLASGSDGDVYRWDVKSRRCIERFSNGDGTITSSLAASNTSLAVGAESGVVNLYSEHRSQQSRSSLLSGIRGKTPLKSIMNLRTSADVVQFNSDGQILAMTSQREKHGLKLFHVPSRTVFSNWPTAQTPLGYVWSMSFSPGSKFLAIGNDKGKCLLYKVKHYHH